MKINANPEKYMQSLLFNLQFGFKNILKQRNATRIFEQPNCNTLHLVSLFYWWALK